MSVLSTDEQKRKGYSLPEQEDRLIKYSKYNNIEVKGIYCENYSAKNFNRPGKNYSQKLKRDHLEKIKISCLSNGIDLVGMLNMFYEMISLLRKYKTVAMAIEHPIDFSVPESTVMLAVYLAVPEAENLRRAQLWFFRL